MKTIYIGLPVKDLARSTAFYTALGFRKDDKFSDDTTSTMTWSENITFQLQTHAKFKGWVEKGVVDARTTAGALFTVSQEQRGHVDRLVETAAKLGGKAGQRAPIDLGWLYNRGFEDPDGHMFEAVWLDTAGAAAM